MVPPELLGPLPRRLPVASTPFGVGGKHGEGVGHLTRLAPDKNAGGITCPTE